MWLEKLNIEVMSSILNLNTNYDFWRKVGEIKGRVNWIFTLDQIVKYF